MTRSPLHEIRELAAEYAECELQAAKARVRLNARIRDAALLFPQNQIARAAGLSRQRIGQIVSEGRGV